MMINRRHAIKQFVFVSAGIALIPSCMQDRSKASILLKNMSIDGKQEKLLAELAETIIPATDTPGAKDISAHLFALKMMDDCYSRADQQRFIKGMTAFDHQCKTAYGNHFADCTPQQRIEFLQKTPPGNEMKNDRDYFYTIVKHLTIEAYTTSKFYMTKINVYKLVPGRFHGCMPVKTSV